ncbi:MAG: alpha/beta fold hydrolase [Methylibium sp.]|nr:alpha/beta fold hydrolase [Methylibium sp.]
MLARLQRFMVASIVLAALAWLAGVWALGHPWLAVAGSLFVLLGYTLVLGIEFVMLAFLHRDDPTPRASPWQLLRAWFGECIVAARVFGWRQPFRSRALPDVPGRPGVRGIVFVHGYLCNRGLWNPWLKRCAAVRQPCIAVSLEPVFSELDAYVQAVDRAVEKLERETGSAPLLVCHSMGGLVARAWLGSAADADSRVHHVFTIGTPHQGTWLAQLSRTDNARHMRQSCDWLCQLAQREPANRAANFTCFYGHADNIVIPPAAAILPGAASRHLCHTAHVAMAFHTEVISEVSRWLDADGSLSRAAD